MRITRPADLSRTIKTRRHELDLTQQQIAERAGVTRQLIARIENGTGDPSVLNVLRVLHALGVTLEASVPGTQENPAEASETVASPGDSAAALQNAITRHLEMPDIALVPQAMSAAEARSAFDAYFEQLKQDFSSGGAGHGDRT